MAEVLKVEKLYKTYGSGRLAVEALKGIDLTVNAGDLVALLGPSGSGKTTLLMCISLILEPTAGKVWLDGETLYDNGWKEVDIRQIRLRKIGFIFQARNLIPFLTALENVMLPLDLLGLEKKEAYRRAMELLEYMEIAERANYLPALMSGGEQQRVAIARALASSPKLLLADEPTGALDSDRGMKVMKLLKSIAREKQTAVICVTHDERMIEGFDFIYRLKDGQISLNNHPG
jgi:putative ABC transport system ATP-binding protein|uniref:ABC transporter ATP-binding protein n=1 Tax=Desulfobacca acetoxidans TaxID=60893 RepID=A0A7C3SHU7_9BACT